MLWGALRAAIVHPRIDNTLLDKIVDDILDAVERALNMRPSADIFGKRFTTIFNPIPRRATSQNAGAIQASLPTLISPWTTGRRPVIERFFKKAEDIHRRKGLPRNFVSGIDLGDGMRRQGSASLSGSMEDLQTSGWDSQSRKSDAALFDGMNQPGYSFSVGRLCRRLGELIGWRRPWERLPDSA